MKPTGTFHRLLRAAVSGQIILASLAGSVTTAYAQASEHYIDVQSGVWYEDAASALLESGALDADEDRLRPFDLATRAEAMKLLVQVYDEPLITPATASFSDVAKSAWYYPYIETAASVGWLQGDKNCYQNSTPCYARPADNVNRAEMAIILQRAYALGYLGTAPVFSDNKQSEWYFSPIQIAADHCILQGDDNTGRVRPASFMNRAEMVVMFHRASMDLRYGEDCGDMDVEPTGEIDSVQAVASNRIRINFTEDIDEANSDDTSQYEVERVGGEEFSVTDVEFIDANTVEITLDDDMTMSAQHRVTVRDLETEGGDTFTDTSTFTSLVETRAEILSVDQESSTKLRVEFSVDLDEDFANDAFRYEVENLDTSNNLTVTGVSVQDDRTVDITVSTALNDNTSYRLNVEDMQTESGDEFSDSFIFNLDDINPTLSGSTVLSATRVRLNFNTDLDETRAEQVARYNITSNGSTIDVGSATLVNDRQVDLLLGDPLQIQRSYQIEIDGLLTEGGLSFTSTGSFIYGTAALDFDATLTGAKEVPPVASAATGTGTFRLTASGLQYDITVKNLSGSVITGAHFHKGGSGVSGPVVEPITMSGTTHAAGTWSNLTTEERNDLLNGNIYVNVHTIAYPNGEIRGQVEQ